MPNAPTQAEIAAPSIPPRQIIAARQAHTVGEMAELFGKFRLNWTTALPGTIVPAAVALDAIRMLGGEVSVSKTYE